MWYSNGAIVKTALLLSKKVRFIFIWVEQVVSFDGKQHNRGQEGAGLACVKLHARPAEEFIYRERAIGTSAIQEIFANIKGPNQEHSSRYGRCRLGSPTFTVCR